MKPNYETLDDYLIDLDAIKEKVAEETKGMTAKQIGAHFARAARQLEVTTGQKLTVRRGRMASAAKRRRNQGGRGHISWPCHRPPSLPPAFLGRPRGLSVCSIPRRRATPACQVLSPNGLSHWSTGAPRPARARLPCRSPTAPSSGAAAPARDAATPGLLCPAGDDDPGSTTASSRHAGPVWPGGGLRST